ncbi:MAG: MFS transporter [Betaproteobacteria bacterium]|nr:MFS transporter [Betaproteobacteria bacterium]
MNRIRSTIIRLACGQALLLTNGVMLIAVNGLVGLALAPQRWMATLPVTAYVVGAALSTVPASFFMKRHGRRAGFMLGSCLGIVGALVGAAAVALSSFWMLCAGTLVSGMYNAFGQYYRFAAADAAPVDLRARAISWVLAGGIVGGVVGPETAKFTRGLVEPFFLASYASLALFALVSLLVVRTLAIPPLSQAEAHAPGRPLAQIARQPAFIVAVLAAAIGYGVMNLLMAATPLAMDVCGHPFSDAALVLQWHVIAMFAPGFVTGHLIRRYGVLNVLLCGAALMLACVGVVLTGVSLMHFWWALVLLGVGWNFLFIGGTTLLTECCVPSERAKVQGSNDFVVFAMQMLSSLASGAVVTGPGWGMLNQLAIPLVAVTAFATAVLWLQRRREAAENPS